MVFFRSRAAHRANAYGEGSQPRGRQGPADYDVFEGLPVRRWARQTFVVSQTPKSVDPDGQLGWMQNPSELPMPKDSHLLSPASRALLSSVRAGCKYVKAPERSNRDGGDAKDANGPDGKLAVPFARTFTVGRWAALPRHMDPPEPEYLAKRRSNFVPMTGLTGTGSDFISAGNAKLRRTKFKRTDPATGTVMVYDAAVPEGHTVEGEVTKDEHTAQQPKEGTIATPSPGTVIEGVGIVDPGGVVIANVDEVLVTPIPRRRFPPKRKFRGAGRGRRKKVMFAHGGGEGYGGGGHQTMSASGLDPTSASGADNSGRPEDHPTPNGHDDDLDGDNDNYGDESDEDEEMTDRPDSD
ncbi:autophagy protein atg9, partial [Ascosphaera pollenicola]